MTRATTQPPTTPPARPHVAARTASTCCSAEPDAVSRLLVLHGGAGPESTTPILDRYAATHDVLAEPYLNLLADLALEPMTRLR